MYLKRKDFLMVRCTNNVLTYFKILLHTYTNCKFIIAVPICKEPKPIAANVGFNPIQCFNRELKVSNALRGDFWVFYNYIPAKGRYSR